MSRSESGRQAKRRGDAFEQLISDHHKEALRRGLLAHVEHTEPHFKKIHGRFEHVKAGVADFVGVLFEGGGRTLAVECKAREERLYRSDIEPKQAAHLDAVSRAGGLALLAVRLVEVTDMAEFETEYIVPWSKVPWKTLKSAESVEPKDLEPFRLPTSCKCYLEKFVTVRGEPVAVPRRIFPRE